MFGTSAARPPARRIAPDVGRRRSCAISSARWNFPGDRAFEAVDSFSGGETARLALALIAYRRPNVLLLDEPTNHLDLDMREALAEALSDFDGAIVLVSHDRHLIGLVCDNYWRVADGKVEPFDGDLDEYAAWLRTRAPSRRQRRRPPAPRGAAGAPARRRPSRCRKVNPHKLQKAEALVADLRSEAGRHRRRQLADPTIYGRTAAAWPSSASARRALQSELESAEADLAGAVRLSA